MDIRILIRNAALGEMEKSGVDVSRGVTKAVSRSRPPGECLVRPAPRTAVCDFSVHHDGRNAADAEFPGLGLRKSTARRFLVLGAAKRVQQPLLRGDTGRLPADGIGATTVKRGVVLPVWFDVHAVHANRGGSDKTQSLCGFSIACLDPPDFCRIPSRLSTSSTVYPPVRFSHP